MKKLIAGNWKMNGSFETAHNLVSEILKGLEDDKNLIQKADFLVCPPYPYLSYIEALADESDAVLHVGAQDCSIHHEGAYTGDVSGVMLADAGCSYVIVGHSERRDYHSETSALVAQKASLAHENNMVAIICVGETAAQRDEGAAQSVVSEQIAQSVPSSSNAKNTVIAYEPVWAIGTGNVAGTDDIKTMHAFIREQLKEKLADSSDIRILYGGSVKPDNAGEILNIDNVDGALIGGASLKAESFLGIAKAI